jgi:hypothetical protein
MPESELTKLRRGRLRVHRQLGKLEPMVAAYQEKLAKINARIQVISPELDLPHRAYRKNPLFERKELPRLVMRIMREAGEPLAVKEIALRALATKGIAYPDKVTMRRVRRRLQGVFNELGHRGIVGSVGEGKRRKRVLRME